MPTLTITRGLPGSGKTTWAKGWVAEDPTHRGRLNRDDFRDQLHAGVYAGEATERQVTAAQHAAVTALLKRGVDVAVDDTNLRQRHARDLRRLAVLAGARFEIIDMTDVSVEECIRRDAGRDRVVGEAVIRDMWTRFLCGRPHPLPWPEDGPAAGGEAAPYVPVPGTPAAIMVDLDGTVALMAGRSPFDETRVHEDRPNLAVIAAVRAHHVAGHLVIFCSGRTDGCRAATEKWLAEHVAVPYEALHMRSVGDTRQDAQVKLELFDRKIRDRYTITCVYDDRDQVVAAWRSIGLAVFQVAPGDF